MSKNMKIVKKISTENCHFYSSEKSIHILHGCVFVMFTWMTEKYMYLCYSSVTEKYMYLCYSSVTEKYLYLCYSSVTEKYM